MPCSGDWIATFNAGPVNFPNTYSPTSYASLDIGQREEWVEGMLRSLDRKKVKARSGPVRSTKKVKAQSGPVRSEKKVEVNENLDAPIDTIKGLSDKMSPKFRRLGVETVRDMLYFFPRRHIDYSKRKTIAELGIGDEQTVIATVWQAQVAILGGRRSTEAIVGDESGNMRVVWFNQPYLSRQLRTNSQLVLSGKVSLYKGIKVFQSPQYEPLTSEDLTHTGRLIPLYPLTGGLSPRMVRKLVKDTVDQWAPRLPDFLPEEVRERAKLLGLPEAIRQAHYPGERAV